MRLFSLVATALFAATSALAETPAPAADEAAAKEQKAASLAALKTVKSGLEDRAALTESLALARKAVRRVRGLTWDREERRGWADAAMQVVKESIEESRTAKAATPPDWASAAPYLKVASAVAAGLFPEEFPAAEMQALERDKDDAVERWYFGDTTPKGSGPKDLMADTWKWRIDPEIRSTKTAESWVLENVDSAGRPAFVSLDGKVAWKDYRVTMDFTTDDRAFVFFQRQEAPAVPSMTHDVMLLVQGGNDVVKPGAPCTLSFWVYGQRARIQKGDQSGKSMRCAPSGSRAGGFSFRLPSGGKLTIRKLEVTVFEEETE